jgi:uncharacterized protein YfiM (DUF2279 family)
VIDGLARLAVMVTVLTAAEPPVQHGAFIDRLPPPAAVRGGTDAWLGSDKFQHFWLSYATAAFTFAGVRSASGDSGTALWIALPVAAAAGVGKEVHDRRRGGIFSMRDLVADALGIGAAYFLLREVR